MFHYWAGVQETFRSTGTEKREGAAPEGNQIIIILVQQMAGREEKQSLNIFSNISLKPNILRRIFI